MPRLDALHPNSTRDRSLHSAGRAINANKFLQGRRAQIEFEYRECELFVQVYSPRRFNYLVLHTRVQ